MNNSGACFWAFFDSISIYQIPIILIWFSSNVVITWILIHRYTSGSFKSNDALLAVTNVSEILTLSLIVGRTNCEMISISKKGPICTFIVPYFAACTRYAIQICLMIVTIERYCSIVHPFELTLITKYGLLRVLAIGLSPILLLAVPSVFASQFANCPKEILPSENNYYYFYYLEEIQIIDLSLKEDLQTILDANRTAVAETAVKGRYFWMIAIFDFSFEFFLPTVFTIALYVRVIFELRHIERFSGRKLNLRRAHRIFCFSSFIRLLTLCPILAFTVSYLTSNQTSSQFFMNLYLYVSTIYVFFMPINTMFYWYVTSKQFKHIIDTVFCSLCLKTHLVNQKDEYVVSSLKRINSDNPIVQFFIRKNGNSISSISCSRVAPNEIAMNKFTSNDERSRY